MQKYELNAEQKYITSQDYISTYSATTLENHTVREQCICSRVSARVIYQCGPKSYSLDNIKVSNTVLNFIK